MNGLIIFAVLMGAALYCTWMGAKENSASYWRGVEDVLRDQDEARERAAQRKSSR